MAGEHVTLPCVQARGDISFPNKRAFTFSLGKFRTRMGEYRSLPICHPGVANHMAQDVAQMLFPAGSRTQRRQGDSADQSDPVPCPLQPTAH